MSFDWNDVGQRRRLLLDLHRQVGDLKAIAKDMFAHPRDRELGAATHRQRCEELLSGLLYTLHYALTTSGGPAPGSEPEGGEPAVH